jgi:hypothetical protein
MAFTLGFRSKWTENQKILGAIGENLFLTRVSSSKYFFWQKVGGKPNRVNFAAA